MSSSTKIDVNFLSLNPEGNWTQNGGRPDQKVVDFPEDRIVNPENPTQYASLVKITSDLVVELKGITVGQAAENSVDIQNKAHATLEGTFGSDVERAGNQIFSVKGGSTAILSGYVKGSGNRLGADIIVDTWSDQCYAGSTLDITNLVHKTNRKLRIVKRYGASTVKFHDANAEILVLPSIENTIYWWVKRIARIVLRIPIGEKGPSFI
jgi:hypothetical protein